MPQGDVVGGHRHQAGPLELRERVDVGAYDLGGRQDRGEPCGVVRRGDQQQGLGVLGEAACPVQENPLDPFGHRQPRGQRLLTRQLSGGQDSRQLAQGQRVATGVGHQQRRHLGRDVGSGLLRQHRRCPGKTEPRQRQGRQIGRVERAGLALPSRPQQCDRLHRNAPGDELQRSRRGVVEPLRVVDHHEHRLLLGRVRQQRQHAEEDQEPVTRVAGLQAERHAQSVAPAASGSGPGTRDSGDRRRCSAANASGASDSMPEVVTTDTSPDARAASMASLRRAVLPAPASAVRTRLPPWPRRARTSRSAIAACSGSLPCNATPGD